MKPNFLSSADTKFQLLSSQIIALLTNPLQPYICNVVAYQCSGEERGVFVFKINRENVFWFQKVTIFYKKKLKENMGVILNDPI